MASEYLEAAMFMKLNRKWTDEIDSNLVIRDLCDSSSEFTKLLEV